MSDYGKQVVTIVELDVPECQLEYGTTNAFGTCNAQLGPDGGTQGSPPVANTGTRKCYQGRANCQDPESYLPATQVIRFSHPQRGLTKHYDNVFPFLTTDTENPVTTPGAINLGGMDRSLSALGAREVVDVTLQDERWNDHLFDKYRLERISGDASLLAEGTASAGAASSLTLESAEDAEEGNLLRLVSGAGSVQERTIASMAGAVATVSPGWGAEYLSLPGTSGNYASTPDSAAVSITGDIDIRVKAALDDWTPATIQDPLSKWDGGGGRSYLFSVNANGTIRLIWDGADGSHNISSTAAPTVSDGATLWIRATLDADNDASGHDVKFFTSSDGESWAQLGATVTTAGTTDIDDNGATLKIGTDGGSRFVSGKVYYAEVRNGIDGTVVAKFDPINDALLGDTSFTSDTGEVWTINQSGDPAAELVGTPDSTTDYTVHDAFDPAERGTFWGKFIRRNPYSASYRARVRRGFMGDALEDMNVRSYIVDRITGPRNGRVEMALKDLFSLIEARKAVAPVASQGELFAGINSSTTSATLSPTGIGNAEYPASGHICINDEVMSFTRSGDALTITRAQLNTEAQEHDAEDLVQLVLSFSSELVQDIIYELLTEYAEIPAANIDKDEWDVLADAAGMDDLYTARIVEPTPVKDLIGELCEQAGCTVWHDPATDMIKFKPLRPSAGSVTVTDREWIINGTMDMQHQDNKRVSRTAVYFAQRNPTIRLDDRRNFRQRSLTIDSDAESEQQYGTPAIREIYSRWVPQFASDLADSIGARMNALFRDPPIQASFRIFRDRDGQLQLAEPFDLETFEGQDDTGAVEPLLLAPVQIARGENEIEIKAQGVTFFAAEDDTGERTIQLNSTDMRNLNLRTIHDSIYSAPTGDEVITFVLPAGFTVGSTSTGAYAIDTGSWPEMATAPTLVIDGRGQGKSGHGGQGGGAQSNGDGANGGDGGPSLKFRVQFTLDGNGEIFGGAGAGGGGGAWTPNGATWWGAGAGSPGAGTDSGDAGSGGVATLQGTTGAASTLATADSPGTPGPRNVVDANSWSGTGGLGGGPGQAGSAGEAASPDIPSQPGGNGGAAGAAIDGVSLVTFAGGHSLDIRGAQIN